MSEDKRVIDNPFKTLNGGGAFRMDGDKTAEMTDEEKAEFANMVGDAAIAKGLLDEAENVKLLVLSKMLDVRFFELIEDETFARLMTIYAKMLSASTRAMVKGAGVEIPAALQGRIALIDDDWDSLPSAVRVGLIGSAMTMWMSDLASDMLGGDEKLALLAGMKTKETK